MVAERLHRQRRHPVAGATDDPVDDVDRGLSVASAQMPARAFRKHEIDQHRHDGDRQPARQCQKAKGVFVAGEQTADERHHGERGGQRHLIDRAIGAPVLRRHQFGGDRERGRDGAARADAGQQTHDDQLLGGLHQRDQQRETGRGDHADQHDRLAAPMVGHRRGQKAADAQHEGRADGEPLDVGPGQMQRRLGQHQERPGHHQIVALDKADEGEHGDDQDVVGAERDAVELVAEHKARAGCRCANRADICHRYLPNWSNRRRLRRRGTGEAGSAGYSRIEFKTPGDFWIDASRVLVAVRNATGLTRFFLSEAGPDTCRTRAVSWPSSDHASSVVEPCAAVIGKISLCHCFGLNPPAAADAPGWSTPGWPSTCLRSRNSRPALTIGLPS